jgi:quercetin dioxygenase-like cupin family protein
MYIRAPQQPIETTIHEADGLFVKQYVVPAAHTFLPQHTHALSHLTLVSVGAVRVRIGDVGQPWRHHEAPAPIFVAAGVKHLFETLADNTVLYCIHSLATPDALKVLAEHHVLA